MEVYIKGRRAHIWNSHEFLLLVKHALMLIQETTSTVTLTIKNLSIRELKKISIQMELESFHFSNAMLLLPSLLMEKIKRGILLLVLT